MAKGGRFRGRAAPCFFGSSETNYAIHRKASEGEHGVYDLMPNAADWFGIWENNQKRVNPDYYITATASCGCGPARLPAAITRQAGGDSWTPCKRARTRQGRHGEPVEASLFPALEQERFFDFVRSPTAGERRSE